MNRKRLRHRPYAQRIRVVSALAQRGRAGRPLWSTQFAPLYDRSWPGAAGSIAPPVLTRSGIRTYSLTTAPGLSDQTQRPLRRSRIGVNNILLRTWVRLKIAFTPSSRLVIRNRKVPEDGRV
jgi:hypothetical protein